MSRLTATPVKGFAHCRDARCPGYSQEEVDAVQEVHEVTYVDAGGDMPGVQNSHVTLRFADEADAPCGTCKHPREVTDQKRRVYAPLSGHAQDGLLHIKPPEQF